MSFDLMGLADETLRAVTEAGYETPTPIQKQAIPVVLQGRDVMGIAQTGTGKTAGFTLPMIDILAQGRARARMPRSLILEPTRELAAQVAESFETYGKYHKLSMALLIGGVSFEDQNKKLDRGVDVLIATPGRLLDHFERGRLMMSGVEILVVDEADRMLDMGFIPDIERICKMMPQRHQTLFFSATMPSEIKRLSDTFLDDPKAIEVARPTSPAETVEQFLVIEKSKELKAKRDTLRRLIDDEEIGNAIIFCNRKKDVDIVAKSLKKHGHNAASLHGDMDQMSRMKVLTAFKANEITLLVASDVAARGLDIPAVSHVFNFDVPNHAEDYIHRIGRTGRAGRSGRAFTICSPFDSKYLASVHDMIGRKIPLFDSKKVENPEKTEEEGQPKRRGRKRRSSNRSEAPSPKTEEVQASAPETTQAVEPAPTQPAAEAQPATAEAQAPQAEQTEEKPRRSRSRGGRRNNRRDDNQSRDNSQSNGNNARPEARRTAHGDKIPEPNGIKGLGDHTPAFLLQPVIFPSTRKKDEDEDVVKKPKKTTRKKAVAKPAADKSTKANTETGDTDKPAKKPRVRKSRAKKVESPEASEAVVEVTPEVITEPTVEAASEVAAEATTPVEKPKRKRAPRKRKTVAEKAAEKAAKEAAADASSSAEITESAASSDEAKAVVEATAAPDTPEAPTSTES